MSDDKGNRSEWNQLLVTRNLVYVAGVLLVSFIGASYWKRPAEITFTPSTQRTATQLLGAPSVAPTSPTASPKPAPTEVVVHVAGAVKHPGLFHLPVDSRVEDAIRAAGGSLDVASLDDINLAAKLADGCQVYIPKKAKDGEPSADLAKVNPTFAGGASAPNGFLSKPSAHTSESSSKSLPAPGSISLNSGTGPDFDRLPGVGPSTAAKILDYRREHGGFGSIDELLSVKGIGPKKMAAMRKYLKL